MILLKGWKKNKDFQNYGCISYSTFQPSGRKLHLTGFNLP